MNGCGKSDSSIVPKKSANKGDPAGFGTTAEQAEGRGLAKGKTREQNRYRTQCREHLGSELTRIRQVAATDKEEKFTALWHHVYDIDRLRDTYYRLKHKGAQGVDGETWKHYGEGPALEDKIVQGATAEVLGAIYEVDFQDFSYGFRPGRGQHDALDALAVGIEQGKVSFVVDADIRSFFDTIDHECLLKFVEHRISDKRVLRHIKKWLKAGVFEDGQVRETEAGTPQGGSISPILANIYLHYALDNWAKRWQRLTARGDVLMVRFADDAVFGFQYRSDAVRFLAEMRERLSRFKLELHAEKTRLIEFGRFAAANRERRGEGKPETFDFLGFTHICSKTRRGKFALLRQTKRKKMEAKLRELRIELRKRLHQSVQEVGEWLCSVVGGYYNYYGVPRNLPALYKFHKEVIRLWMHTLKRRSQKNRITWERMKRLIARWLPRPTVTHPYPDQRLAS